MVQENFMIKALESGSLYTAKLLLDYREGEEALPPMYPPAGGDQDNYHGQDNALHPARRSGEALAGGWG